MSRSIDRAPAGTPGSRVYGANRSSARTPIKMTAAEGRRFRPAALPTLAAIVAVAVCIAAGNWQRGRMQAKEALRAQFDAMAAAEPLDLVGPAGEPAAWRYRRVRATGEYAAAHQILLDNQVLRGRAGYHAIAPLRLSDGRFVLVDRGWIAQGPTRADVPAVPPPPGTVSVSGRINLVPGPAAPVAAEPDRDVVWQRVDRAALARLLDGEVLPFLIEQDAQGAPADGLVRDWPAPDFGIDKHRVYMGQWYAFAALAAGLWVWFTWRGRRGEPDA